MKSDDIKMQVIKPTTPRERFMIIITRLIELEEKLNKGIGKLDKIEAKIIKREFTSIKEELNIVPIKKEFA